MEHAVTIQSDGIALAGVLHIPDSYKVGDRLPAFVVLHGFIGSKDESHANIQATAEGRVTLRSAASTTRSRCLP